MKENNKYIVFYSAENDRFLKSYKDKGNLAFTATFGERLGGRYSYHSNHTKNKKLA